MEGQSLLKRSLFYVKRKILEFNFDSRKYWELRYQHDWNSGSGSYGASSTSKATVFNKILKDLDIESIIEFGCGDGNQLKLYEIKNYLGLDVSKRTIQNISKLFEKDPSKSFFWYDPEAFYNHGNVFSADASISVDVLFHLVEEAIFEKYMHDLFSCAKNYVLIYSTNQVDEENPVSHLRNREFTPWIEKNISGWELSEERETISDEGEKFLNWYIYKRK